MLLCSNRFWRGTQMPSDFRSSLACCPHIFGLMRHANCHFQTSKLFCLQSGGRAATQTGEYRRHWLCHLLTSFLLLPLISSASKRFSCNLRFQIHLFPVVLHPLCKFSPKDSHLEMFPGMFAKLRKTTIKYVMSVCPSVSLPVCPNGKTCLSLNEF
jgi:hypothetical protein